MSIVRRRAESGGRGHREGFRTARSTLAFQPRGNETVGTDEDAANAMLFGPVDEAGIVALQGQGLRSFAGPTLLRENEARVQRREDPVVAAGQHQGGIGLEPERNPLVAGEKLIELAFALRGPDFRLRRHLADQASLPLAVKTLRWMAGGGKKPPRAMKARKRLDMLRQAKTQSRTAPTIWLVGMIREPSRRETSTIWRTTGARSTS